ncbi:LCP family protein [Secundilactobacillus paracollinoides]|uniref:LCP family protein n=1 Tax=Secundilactobacillus paracollinoides TaxID=240427 RepID=UPI0006EF9B13|nr:LCP family protein [Secundilactobacillus paracollinoides]KRL78654.1 Transcriptional regulator [Secundilactobacillus paracollinoides DSM 15502 = JCM 11969]
MNNQLPPRHRQRRRTFSRIRTIVLSAIIVLLLGVGASAAYVYYQAKGTLSGSYSAVNNSNKTAITKNKPISVLLMGTDTGALGRTFKGRTDTMIVVTINPKTKKTTMVSIPRDTVAKIYSSSGQSQGVQKINAAYTIGGAGGAIKTVEKLTNVPINYYVTMNMGGLEKVVNAIGGITVKADFSWTDSATHSSFTKGTHHVNGKRALAFARMRDEDPQGDYGRQKRQQQVITAIIKKVMATKSVSTYHKLLSLVSSNMKTDLSFNNMLELAKDDRQAGQKVKKTTLQGTGAYIEESSYQVPSTKELNRVSKMLRASLGLSAKTVSNYNTKENKLNVAAGFDFSNGNNPTYTLYDASGNASTSDDTTTTAAGSTTTGGTTDTTGGATGGTTGGGYGGGATQGGY